MSLRPRLIPPTGVTATSTEVAHLRAALDAHATVARTLNAISHDVIPVGARRPQMKVIVWFGNGIHEDKDYKEALEAKTIIKDTAGVRNLRPPEGYVLSNFYKGIPLKVGGVTYQTGEHAFHAAKLEFLLKNADVQFVPKGSVTQVPVLKAGGKERVKFVLDIITGQKIACETVLKNDWFQNTYSGAMKKELTLTEALTDLPKNPKGIKKMMTGKAMSQWAFASNWADTGIDQEYKPVADARNDAIVAAKMTIPQYRKLIRDLVSDLTLEYGIKYVSFKHFDPFEPPIWGAMYKYGTIIGEDKLGKAWMKILKLK